VDINDDVIFSSFFKKGKINDLPTYNNIRYIPDVKGFKRRGIAMQNMPLLQMYEAAITLNNDFSAEYNNKRFILEIRDSSFLIFDKKKSAKNNWEKDHLYTYDLVVPSSEEEQLYSRVIEDLNKYSGYYGRIEKRKIKCLVMLNGSGPAIPHRIAESMPSSSLAGNKYHFKNLPLNTITRLLSLDKDIRVEIISKVNPSPVISLDYDKDHPDLNTLRNELKTWGIDLVEQEEELDVFVLSEKENPVQNKTMR
jgi:hypothetical protein